MRDYKFGNFLTSLRKQCGYTQYELGKLLGVSDKAVSKWENGTAKPSIDILIDLSNLLNVSIEELLTCSHHEDTTCIKSIKNNLFSNVERKLKEKYSNNLPIEVWNLYLLEKNEISKIPSLCQMLYDLYNIFEIINSLGIQTILRMNISSSLIVNTLGIANANPLPPHYYCPKCKTIIFKKDCLDSFDLKNKTCSCGNQFITDGHNIPFDIYKNNFNTIDNYIISTSQKNIIPLKQIIKTYYQKEYFVTALDGKTEFDEDISVIKICTHKPKELIQQICFDLSYEDYNKEINKTTAPPYIQTLFESETITIIEDDILKNLNTSFKIKDIKNKLYENNNKNIKELINIINPTTYYEIIKLININLSSYDDNYLLELQKELKDQTITFDEIFTCREEVFLFLIDKFKPANAIVDFITKKIRQGKSKVAEHQMQNLKMENFEQYFQGINSFTRIKYLVFKAISIQILNNLLNN